MTPKEPTLVRVRRAPEAPRPSLRASLLRAGLLRAGLLGFATLAMVAGCSDADLDLRGLGNGFDTSEAALTAVADRPDPDSRGIISYPGYQVVLAERGDTVADVASRIGLPADELARFNGAPADAVLNRGEVLALPRRVAEPSPATGAAGTGPIQPPGAVDVASLAGEAIDRAESGAAIEPAPAPRGTVQTGEEPIRHKVVAGETAFSISRRYNVPVSALGEWNGLDRDYTIRTGQFLMIPPAAPGAAPAPAAEPTPPGSGSPTPTPPSAAQPLPEDTASAAAAGAAGAASSEALPDSPNLSDERTSASASDSVFVSPVAAPIVAEFREGTRDGISFRATPGEDVRAAGTGRVRSVIEDQIEDPDKEARVVILTHDDGVSTVYVNVAGLSVGEGDSVSRGQVIGKVGDADPPVFQFQVREGASFTAVDPNGYIQ
ncbi:MAG: M23 family metallopeptidase [Pseudomonadota bacterium]